MADPAHSVLLSAHAVAESPGSTPGSRRLRLLYRVLKASRGVLALRFCARLLRHLAILNRARQRASCSSADIGRIVHAVEREVPAPDCYPRALLTLYLALRAGRGGALTIGVLAPTRKMHAWCTIGSDLPYEPAAEHYLYQPLWTLTLPP